MKTAYTRRQSFRGTTLVELLMAGLLLSIGMMGLVGTWVFSFRVTANTDDMAIAYNLGRAAVEDIKRYGFPNAPEGTTTTYYNGNQSSVSQDSSRFTVVSSLVSAAVKSGSSGVSGAVPADSTIRTVTVTVTLTSTGASLYTTTTYMVRAGI